MVAGLLGCGGGSTAPPRASDPPTETPGTADGTVRFPDLSTTTSAAPATTLVPPATVAADDLPANTAIAPLEGFAEVAAAPGIGPLDLAAAAHDEPRERDALLRFGFRDGHARGFTRDGEEIVVTVLRFGSAAQAGAYLQDTLDSSLVGNGSFLFAVPVPGATGYREQGAGEDGEPFVTYGALFARGDRCYEQLIRSPASGRERSEADAQALARRQAERVGG
jgi:hypothetical protein